MRNDRPACGADDDCATTAQQLRIDWIQVRQRQLLLRQLLLARPLLFPALLQLSIATAGLPSALLPAAFWARAPREPALARASADAGAAQVGWLRNDLFAEVHRVTLEQARGRDKATAGSWHW